MITKGIVLAGGSGTRLFPVTHAVSKQLLPVYDKPLIYYPLATLMLAGIYDILIITTPEDQPAFQRLLQDGSQWSIKISYLIQETPGGIAQALILADDFIDSDGVCLILGDNVFYGHGFPDQMRTAVRDNSGATVFGYYVSDPERYGVLSFDANGRVLDIEEKPREPKSHYAVTGLYLYDQRCVQIARDLKPSARGELEITDVNRAYLQSSQLRVEILGRGVAWLDTGTHDSLLQAANYIAAVETRQGLKVCCPEEIAFRQGLIDRDQLKELTRKLGSTSYADYLRRIDQHHVF
jgi:glucose-1-phosphate thymidylyltransferase